LGMVYRFSETNRRLSSARNSNIVTRLDSRSLKGHELPIQVHQHYALEFHLILHPNNNNDDSIETCMRRAFRTHFKAKNAC